MKRAKTISIIVAAIFGVSLLFSCFMLSIVKSVKVNYMVTETADISDLAESIDTIRNKSLLFLTEKDVNNVIDGFPYFYMSEKPKKSFPNTVTFTIKERKEVYKLTINDNWYLLDKDGILLSKNSEQKQKCTLIDVDFDGIEITEEVLGKKLSTTANEIFDIFLNMTESISLTDNVKNMTVVSEPEKNDVIYETYTGVKIEIWDIENLGNEKAIAAFKSYNEVADDYYKSFDKIIVSVVNGEIDVKWTERSK